MVTQAMNLLTRYEAEKFVELKLTDTLT